MKPQEDPFQLAADQWPEWGSPMELCYWPVNRFEAMQFQFSVEQKETVVD